MLQIDGQTLRLTPTAEAFEVTRESLSAYDWLWFWPWPAPDPPGLPIELRVPPRRYALCAPTEGERQQLLLRLQDAIDQSHGSGSPYAEWRLGETLGEGTFGTVRTATHRASGETCAVKVLSLLSLQRQGNARRAVERERAIMLKVQRLLPVHAPLIQLRQLAEFGDNLFFFIAPQCTGDLLGLLQQGVFAESAAAAVTSGALLAVAALHRAGVVHLDVKPQNLLYRAPPSPMSRTRFVTPSGEAAELYLGDFGCGRLASPSTSRHPALACIRTLRLPLSPLAHHLWLRPEASPPHTRCRFPPAAAHST